MILKLIKALQSIENVDRFTMVIMISIRKNRNIQLCFKIISYSKEKKS